MVAAALITFNAFIFNFSQISLNSFIKLIFINELNYDIIILDEADALTLDAQSALRKIIETSSRITRFCFTCNYIDKIIDPIVSRCVKFRFKPIDKDSMIERLKFIAYKEKLVLTNDCFNKIHEISEGDARKAIMLLQNTKYIYNFQKKINVNDIIEMVGLSTNEELESIWNKIKNNSISTLISVVRDINNFGININQFLIFLKDKIIETKLTDDKKSNLIMVISNTESRLIERGDEYLNLLNILCQIYIMLYKS